MKFANKSWPIRCAAVAAMAFCATAASAQQRPGGGYGTTPGGQQPPMQPQQPMQPLPPVPAVDTTPLTQANTAVAKAKADLKKSQGVLFGASKRFEKTIDAKPDVQTATTQLNASQAALQSQTAIVMTKVRAGASYKSAQEAAATAKADVEKLRANPDATPDQRYAAAQTALKANEAVSKIEQTALDGDPAVVASKAKVATENDAVQKLRAKYRAGMKDDADWAAASKDLADKQAKADAADKQLVEAKKTVATAQSAHQAAVIARNKQEAENAARSGGYGVPAGVPGAAPGR